MWNSRMSTNFTINTQQHMLSLINQLASSEGYTQSLLENVTFIRSNSALTCMSTFYEPSIVIILQGRKCGFYNDKQYIYDANNYLVVSIPLPFNVEAEATADNPLLGIILHIDPLILTELITNLPVNSAQSSSLPSALYSSPIDDNFENAVFRLIKSLTSPIEAKVLGPSIYREILYRVLSNEQGNGLREVLLRNSSFGKIANALQYIHSNYEKKIDVSTLAIQTNLSIPAFHMYFKTVTSTSPIQYIKAIRLHKSRLMMVRQGVSAETAARKVGYESASQFSREFKRLFGRSPIEEVKNLKTVLSLSTSNPNE